MPDEITVSVDGGSPLNLASGVSVAEVLGDGAAGAPAGAPAEALDQEQQDGLQGAWVFLFNSDRTMSY